MQEPVTVMVSFVEENAPYRTHPHRLYGKKCKDGVCIVTIKPEDDMTYEFSGLKMQCIRKDDIEKELNLRQKIKVDPFGRGFQHATHKGKINLNSVRLCFQIIEGPQIPPVVSDVIRNAKNQGELKIDYLSSNESSVEGGKSIMLFMNGTVSKDVEVHFSFKNKCKYPKNKINFFKHIKILRVIGDFLLCARF